MERIGAATTLDGKQQGTGSGGGFIITALSSFSFLLVAESHTNVSTEARMKYVVEVEWQGLAPVGVLYIEGDSDANPQFDAASVLARYYYNGMPTDAPITCDAMVNTFQRVCCCGLTAGLLCPSNNN
jgi:hypothetical protein